MTTRPEPYLAFCDGSLDFDCAACTALCCRGQGFGGSLKREAADLLRLYPGLATVAVGRKGDVMSFASPAGACFFLDPDLRCRLHKEHGWALKPGGCALFPFNDVARIGEAIVIRPHFLCPLRLSCPPRPGEVEGSFARVRELAREVGLGDQPETVHAQSLHPSADAVAVVVRETRFREHCAVAIGHRAFRETLAEFSDDSGSLTAFISRALDLLGSSMAEPGPRDLVDDLLLALAPALRVSMLFLPAEGLIRALALGEHVLRVASSLARAPLTLQGGHHLLTTMGPALRLLARGDDPLRPPGSGGGRLPAFGQPDLVLAAAVLLRMTEKPMGTLDALAWALPATMAAGDRSVLLVQVGRALEQEQRDRRAT